MTCAKKKTFGALVLQTFGQIRLVLRRCLQLFYEKSTLPDIAKKFRNCSERRRGGQLLILEADVDRLRSRCSEQFFEDRMDRRCLHLMAQNSVDRHSPMQVIHCDAFFLSMKLPAFENFKWPILGGMLASEL